MEQREREQLARVADMLKQQEAINAQVQPETEPVNAYWACCGNVWAGTNRFCPTCRNWCTVKVAEIDGTPTPEGRARLAALETRDEWMRPRHEGPRKHSGKHRDKKCSKCGRLILEPDSFGHLAKRGDQVGFGISGPIRTKGMLATAVPQQFVSPGTEICVGGRDCQGLPRQQREAAVRDKSRTPRHDPKSERAVRPIVIEVSYKPVQERVLVDTVSWAIHRSLRQLHWQLRRVGARV